MLCEWPCTLVIFQAEYEPQKRYAFWFLQFLRLCLLHYCRCCCFDLQNCVFWRCTLCYCIWYGFFQWWHCVVCSAPYSIECIRSFVVVISLHRTNSPILYRHIQYKTIHNIQSRKPHSFPIYSSLRERYFPRILIFSHLFEAGCFFVHSLPTI